MSELVPEEDKDEGKYSEEEILGIAKAVPNIQLEGNARRAVGVLLSASGHYEAALAQGQLGAAECTDPTSCAESLNLVAQSLWSLKRYDEAYNSINECLSNRNLPPTTYRDALLICAKIEVALGRVEEAAASYKQARLADSDAPVSGTALREEFAVYYQKGVDSELIGVVKEWKPLERVTWMTWGYDIDSSDHEKFQKAAARCGEEVFLVQAYEEVIGFLDTLDSGAPIRINLAWIHWSICSDIGKAKAVLDEVLDSTTTGRPYAFTNEEPLLVCIQVIGSAVDLIYEQFRSTGDRVLKMQLLEEATHLRERTFPGDVRFLQTFVTHHTIVLARMMRKMGPLDRFHDLLDKAFDVCYQGLLDNVGWNDAFSLQLMAEVLSNLDGLEKEARILVSAVFSELDPPEEDAPDKNAADESSTGTIPEGPRGEKEGSDEVAPIDEGDLGDHTISCDGCETSYSWWGGRSLYQCVICTYTYLCEDCFQKRQGYNLGTKRPPGENYCGLNHKYIKGPIEGWKGITKGVMKIEGEKPVKFKDWLDELKEKKWNAAWDRFWRSEN